MAVKNILFRTKIKGYGIVNYDGSEQKTMYYDTNLSNMKTRYDNTSYAKKRFYKDGDKLNYKICISSDCLRHSIFQDEVLYQSPNAIATDALKYSFIASPAMLLRGYLYADIKETLKRTGALTITDAQQTCNAVSYIETFCRSGEKNKNGDEKDNTLFRKEVVGDIKYAAEGNIDLMQLQFVSCDQMFDRYGFNPDLFPMYKQFFKSKMKNFNSDLGYYHINNQLAELPEYGFKLTNENVVELVRYMMSKLLKMKIMRKGTYAEVETLEYKLVNDVIEDTFSNENGWITLKSMEDINNIDFTPEEFYVERDIETARSERKVNELELENQKKESKERKNTKAEEKLKAKEKAKEKTKKPE